MKRLDSLRLLLTLALCGALTDPAAAQYVRRIDGQIQFASYNYGHNQPLFDVSPIGQVVPSGELPVIQGILGVALDRHPADQFSFSKKFTREALTNSCWDASKNLIDQSRSQGLVPEGWKMYQVGQLGGITDVENTVFSGSTYQDRYDPPSYSHTFTIVKSPDGNYYSVDNWGSEVEFRRVYPVESSETFFSNDPGGTSVEDAEFRIQNGSYGLDQNKEDTRNKTSSRLPTVGPPQDTEVVTSMDPNDKLGPGGVGMARYVAPGAEMRYTIRFENVDTASAPASEVVVRDTLDLTAFDPETFAFGPVGVGGREVPLHAAARVVSARVPLAGGRLALAVTGVFVPETGVVTWRFRTLDPATNDLPYDPFDGFLPPNKTAPEGEGFVSFTVFPRAGLPTGTAMANRASIYFDYNDAIVTPVWTNTVDDDVPTSRVSALVADTAHVVRVTWEGTDATSGVSSYDVYVAVNGGPFQLWSRDLSAGEALFQGELDSTYAFFSRAYDAAGHAEPLKTQADRTLRITASGVEDVATGLPVRSRLYAPAPNPAAATAAIGYDVHRPGRVRVAVYDVLGRAVRTLVDADQPPGRYRVPLAVDGLGPGLYFVRMTAGTLVETQRLVVSR